MRIQDGGHSPWSAPTRDFPGTTGPEFVGWWNRNRGFATLTAGLMTFAVMAVYVVLTYGILRQSETATDRAADANDLVRKANNASLEANALLQKANALSADMLSQDRKQLQLAARGHFDSLLPRLTIALVEADLVTGSGTKRRSG
ncbi:MAG: hypothetical protein GY698_21605 [Actinomycetia bacterium]|nr:hypothetical protein [Actinomycetes bacterium]